MTKMRQNSTVWKIRLSTSTQSLWSSKITLGDQHLSVMFWIDLWSLHLGFVSSVGWSFMCISITQSFGLKSWAAPKILFYYSIFFAVLRKLQTRNRKYMYMSKTEEVCDFNDFLTICTMFSFRWISNRLLFEFIKHQASAKHGHLIFREFISYLFLSFSTPTHKKKKTTSTNLIRPWLSHWPILHAKFYIIYFIKLYTLIEIS